MDRFKLLMCHGQPNEWVQFHLLMKESLPVRQQIAQMLLPGRWCVDQFPGALIGQRHARNLPHRHRRALDLAAHLLRRARIHGVLGQRPKSFQQCLAVAQGLLCGRIRPALTLTELEKPVCRRHDILNLGTRLCFQQRQCINQDPLIGNQLSRLLEFCHRGTSLNALLED